MLNKTEEVRQNLTDQLNIISEDILTQFPIEIYMEALSKYPQYMPYKYVSVEVKQIVSEILKMSGPDSLELYHKLILILLIKKEIECDRIQSMPEEIRVLILNNFQLIVDKIQSPRVKKGFFLYSEDKFNKYLTIARLKMIPCGAQKVYAGSLPKKFLFSGDILQFFKGVSLVIRTGGIRPFFKMHMDSSDRQLMKEFNADGFEKFFKRTGKLMKREADIKGICGSSWFFDPLLKEISPELHYIREISERYGALFFDLGSSKGIVKDATFMSPKRIKLYKKGAYTPKGFLMLITRKDLLKNLE